MAKLTNFEIHVDPSCLSDTDKENSMPTERVPSNETVVHHDSWTEDEITKGQHTGDAVEAETEGEISKKEGEARGGRIEKIEAEIRAAARAVITSIEQDNYDNEDSILSTQTDESNNHHASNILHDEGSEDVLYESDHDLNSVQNSKGASDSSSHHDGDIDDDVFSSSNRSSARSSLNSISDLHSIDENHKLLTSPQVGEEAASGNENETISRVPSGSSYARPEVGNERTPSKVLARPPFRTPSAVRAMQMSSPTQSLFASPRSSKRHMPTVSRLGTPNSHTSPTKRTPTRFKVKKEYPLVLLHVTVLPLQWSHSRLMSSDVPESLQNVKESWRLLQDKLGDTVLERGVLLAHPQDSYEVLEERLLEALELPVRPRAQILKCGHYLGPMDSETPSSDEEVGDSWVVEKNGRSWCDICARNVRLEEVSQVGGREKRFNMKIYASNGLMRAGAWAAVWREMERVDVEIEPCVEPGLYAELEHLASITPVIEPPAKIEENDGFVDEEVESVHDHDHGAQAIHEEEVRLHEEEIRRRMAEEEEMQQRMADEEHLRQLRIAEEEEIRQRIADEEHLRQLRIAEEEEMRQKIEQEEQTKIAQMAEEEEMRQKMADEESLRQVRNAEEEEMRQRMADEEHLRQVRNAQEEEMQQRMEQEERMKVAHMTEELGARQSRDDGENLRRKMFEEDRMREIYGQSVQETHLSRSPSFRSNSRGHEEMYGQQNQRSRPSRRHSSRSSVRGDESLSELLLAAFQVAMRDSKNIAILVLSVLILFMALKPSPKIQLPEIFGMPDSAPPAQITTTVFKEAPYAILQISTETPVTSATVAPEPSAIVVTETVAMPQITTTVFKEKTVTEAAPASSISPEALRPVADVKEETGLVVEREAAIEVPYVVSGPVLEESTAAAVEREAAIKVSDVVPGPVWEESTAPDTEIDSSSEVDVAKVTETPAPISDLVQEEKIDAIDLALGEEGVEKHSAAPMLSSLPIVEDDVMEVKETQAHIVDLLSEEKSDPVDLRRAEEDDEEPSNIPMSSSLPTMEDNIMEAKETQASIIDLVQEEQSNVIDPEREEERDDIVEMKETQVLIADPLQEEKSDAIALGQLEEDEERSQMPVLSSLPIIGDGTNESHEKVFNGPDEDEESGILKLGLNRGEYCVCR